MKKTNLLALLFAVVHTAIVISSSSCSKTKEDPMDEGLEIKELASDESHFAMESDLIFTDVNTVHEKFDNGEKTTLDGATVNDTSFIGFKKIVINYTGETLNKMRIRNGSVSIHLIEGSKWIDKGAVIEIEFNNVTITRTEGNKIVNIQGKYYVKNVNGGRAFVNMDVEHKLWGTAMARFGSGSSSEWSISRRRTFSNVNGAFRVVTNGDTTINDSANVIVWGKNRKGKEFMVRVPQELVYSSVCPGRMMSGQKRHYKLTKDVMVTHGVDDKGEPHKGTGCAYGFKVEWTNAKNEERRAVFAY
jgi:hypothetical protein